MGGVKKNKVELEEKESAIKRYRWHIGKMEQIIRMIDNDAIEPGRVEEIKEDIEYYIESNDEMEGMEDFDPYEVLQLDEMPAVLVETVVTPPLISKDDKGGKEKKRKEKKDKKASASPSLLT